MFELMDAYSQSAVIKVLGVGGGGGNAVKHMASCGIEGVDFICTNTDRQALKTSKVKTTLQMFGIAFMVYQQDLLGMELYDIGFILLLAAAGMTLWSMIIYLRAAWPSMQENT